MFAWRNPAQIPACGTTAPGSCLRSDVRAPEGACPTRSGTCDRDDPALCPVLGMRRHVPLASSLPPPPPPVPWATFVRRLPRYYEAVRLPAPVHHGRAPWVHRADLARMGQARYRASRVPYTVFPCMPEVSDPARSVAPRQNGGDGIAFRVFGARRHPGIARFRGSILCLHVPLSTLRRHRYRRLRMTRG